MPWVTNSEVKAAINFPTPGAPVPDSDIDRFILDAQDEIRKLFKTEFGNEEASGTATSVTDSTITDTALASTINEHQRQVLWVFTGNEVDDEAVAADEIHQIISNTATTITIRDTFGTTPSVGAKFRVVDLKYKDETRDGSGNDIQFTRFQPLFDINSLIIDGTNIVLNTLFLRKEAGEIELGKDSSTRVFSRTNPQQVNITYTYGVYPIPRIITRLCVVVAAIRTAMAKVTGSYVDYATISLPGLSGSKGQPYVNLKAGVDELQDEAKEIVEAFAPFQLWG